MCCMLVMAFRCAEVSFYSVFNIDECGGVDFTYFIGYFKAVTV